MEFICTFRILVDCFIISSFKSFRLRATQDQDNSQLPVFQWNCLSSNPAGISIDRTSWIIGENGTNMVYKIDSEDVPRFVNFQFLKFFKICYIIHTACYYSNIKTFRAK